MSDEQGSFWIGMAEKVFGLLLIVIGGLFVYYTATSIDTLGVYTGLFALLSAMVIAAGVFLMIVKPPE